MITISLTNFKNVLSEKTYTFVRGDLFHLTGSSGAGKSSLLEAFEWVIFGKNAGIKPRAHKDLIPRVELKMEGNLCSNNWNIIRDGNDLTVKTSSGKTLTADAAQGYICSVFGDKDLWKCSSYLQQGNRNLLLTGSGEEKLKLLRELTYGYGIGQYDDPDYYLTIIGEVYKKCQKEKNTQAAIYDSFYAETEKVLERFNGTENTWESSDMEIEELKENIREYTKDLKSLTVKLNEQTHLKKEKDDIIKRLSKNKCELDKISLDKISRDHSFDINKEKENINSKINKIKDKIKDLEFSYKVKQYLPYAYDSKEYESLKIQENDYKSWVNKANKLGVNLGLKDLKEKLKQIQEYDNWNRYINLKEKNNYFDEMKVYISDLESDLQKIKEKKSILEKKLKNGSKDQKSKDQRSKEPSKEQSKERSKDILVFDKKRINQIISDFKKKKGFTCPTCNDSLFLNEKGSLSKSGDVNISKLESDLKEIEEILELHDSLENLQNKEKDLNQYIINTKKELDSEVNLFPHEEYKNLKKIVDMSREPKIDHKISSIKESELEELISSFVSSPDLSRMKLLQNGESLAKLLGPNFQKFQKSPESFIDEGTDISLLEKESLSLEKKLESLDLSRENYLKLKTEEEVLTKNLNQIEKRIDHNISEEDLKELEDKLSEYRNLELDYIRYTEMEQRMASLNEHQTKLDELNEKLQRLEIIFETIKKLSIEPIEILIEIINLRFNYYLDKMFIDNPIKVLLSLYKSSSGPKSSSFNKISVNLQVYHGENSYTNINSLSGGESDRVSLALTLALASIVNTPFLFLDECMASLDLELREQCLTLIRETKTEDKIVIDVCHETVEGFHDKIIKIL